MSRLTRFYNFLDRQLSQPFRQRGYISRQQLFEMSSSTIDVHQVGATSQVDYPPPPTPHPPHEIARNIGEHTLDAPFVLTIKNATLQGRHGAVLAQDGRIVLESLLNHAPYVDLTSFSRVHYPQNFQALQRQLLHVPHYESLVSLVTLFSQGYYHWVLESLPRLIALDAYAEQTGHRPPLLIDPHPPQWMRDSLRYMGYNPDDIIEWRATKATVEHLVLPWLPAGTGIPHPESCRQVSERIKANLPVDTPHDAMPYLYISRQRATQRRVLNEDDLLNALDAYGFVRVYLEDYRFAEQVRLFEQAEVVIGAHGAGFANMIHSQNATMLEFFEPTYLNACFYRLASSMGHRYDFVIGETHNADMLVDPMEVRRKLDRLHST